MALSNRLEITELASTQNDRSVTINEAIARLEAGATIFACLNVLHNVPPGSPAEGDMYIIGVEPTGAWIGHEEQPVVYYNGGWLYFPVFEGMYADDGGSQSLYRYSGTSGWIIFATAGAGVAASTTEVLTGTDASKYVTPDSLAALWEKGGDITSAGTISIGEGGFFHVTGTTTITDIDPATDKSGRTFILEFDGALILTHHATTLILPGGASITTAAGDVAIFTSEGSDAVRCISYTRASGRALVGPSNGLTSDTPANLTKGFTATSFDLGTISSGTVTPDPDNGNFQRMVNNGAHTFACPSPSPGDSLSMIVRIENDAAAGAITWSGFTLEETGDITTTDNDVFFAFITVLGGSTCVTIKALQ